MDPEEKEKLRNATDGLSNYLFDRIGEYIQSNEITNQEMIDRQFAAMRSAVEHTEDIRKQ